MDTLFGPMLAFTEEVEDAIAERRPIVALESTLLAHGLPAEEAAEVGVALETIVRSQGAVPATIAAIDGFLQVGLTSSQLERLLTSNAKKASLRDLPFALTQKGVWATTVASTMFVAHRAAIRVFSTGGIGGVHRGVAASWDESADLAALARFPVAVVSAGAKSVLDIPKTCERLETLGVPVVGYQCDEFPAFYHAHSGEPVTARVETPGEVAALMQARFDRLGQAGLLVANPPPLALAQDPKVVDGLIEEALVLAAAQGVKGKHLTPFLLQALATSSNGEVVRTNVALVENNTRLAAQVAVADRLADEAAAS